jgi:hypothetical protein
MTYRLLGHWLVAVAVVALVACGSDGGNGDAADTWTDTGTDPAGDAGSDTSTDTTPPASVCEAAPGGGSASVSEPELLATLSDRWHEGWLGSPAVADLDGDGTMEIIVPRGNLLIAWHMDGEMPLRLETGGRIWASPIVADLHPGEEGLEVVVASRESVYAWNAGGDPLPGFPTSWQDELRAAAAGDIDDDGAFEIAAVTTRRVEAGGQRDLLVAFELDGNIVAGFPPNTTGSSGCDDRCHVTGGYDQTLALGNVDDDDVLDLLAPHDNAYMSLHDGTGRAFDTNEIFSYPTKLSGLRFLHDYDLAQQGYPDDEPTDNQAHFTNSAPAIADIDGDGGHELVVLGSVQNAAQTDRYRGVGLWVLENDGTRPGPWTEPFHAEDYLAGLWDFEGTNVVAATNQVTVADVDGDRDGYEMIFAGFDGVIHCVASDRTEVWTTTYTTDDRVLTGGVVVADLSGDGSPEIVFASYSPDEDKGHLFVLDAEGSELHRIALPMRGAMPVPTIADADGDGDLEIVVSLKDGEDHERAVLVYTVPGSYDNCMPWPTGRANYLRNGYVP